MDLLVRGRWLIVPIFLAAGAWAALMLPGFSVEAGTDVLLDQNDPDLTYYEDSRADWGTDEYLIVCCHRNDGWFSRDALALLNEFIQCLSRLPHAKKLTAITNVPLLRNQEVFGLPTPVSIIDKHGKLDLGVDLEKARDELLDNTQTRGNLISANGQDTSILLYLDVVEELTVYEQERRRLLARSEESEARRRLRTVEALYEQGKLELNRRRTALVSAARALSREWSSKFDEPIRLSGIPLINNVLMEHIQSDLATFGVLSLVMFALTFFVIYRRVRWVVLPVITCLLPVAIMLALMVVGGKKVTIVTSNMPVLLFVLMLPYTVYFIERYNERRSIYAGESPRVTATMALVEIWPPCFYSCLATMAGTVAHVPSGINPVRTFGFMMTIGAAIGLATVMLFLPSIVLSLKGIEVKGGPNLVPRGPLRLLEILVLRVPLGVVLVSLAILGTAIWGTTKLQVETKFINYFWSKSEIYQGLDYIDARMGGTTPLEILLRSGKPGYFKTPEGLAALDAVARFFERIPETGNVRSFKTLVVEAKKALSLSDQVIAKAVTAVAKDQVAEFCNSDFTVSRVLVRMRETAPTLNRNRILGELRAYLDSLKEKELRNVEVRPTGVFLLYANMLNTLIDATRQTFILAVAAIFLMLWLLFRTPLLAIIVLLPQVLPVFLVLGTMGFTGIALDMVTVIIASVAMGVGIDAAIQYTVRFRRELEAVNGDIAQAVRRAHATIGRAILIATSIVFAGFVILMFSNFVPTFYFGLFTGLAILAGLFASLTTLPATFVLLRYPRIGK